MSRIAIAVVSLGLAVPLAAQTSKITEERVRETVTWLASDERGGRGTGSVEIEEAATWIAERFEQFGLKQAREGSWRHEFTMAGVRIDSDAVELTLTPKGGDDDTPVKLVPGKDVRQWLPSDALAGEEVCTVAYAENPVLQRLLTASSARRPIIIEVEEDHAYWLKAEGVHSVISSRRRAARPVLLIRRGLLPALPADQREVVWTANWKVAEVEKAKVAQANVVGMLAAHADSATKSEYVVVSAHYDHLGRGRARNGDGIYNGADDNATGTTAVMLLAEAMAELVGDKAPARNVLFVAFAAEERGLRGSKAFCDRPPVPIEKIVTNLNIEMIGRPAEGKQGKAWVTGAGYSDFAAICEQAFAKSGVALTEFQMAKQLFMQSDNWRFAQHGIVAHSISAGSSHRDYHAPSDEIGKLDIAHMTTIIRGLYDVTLELANREAAPEWNEAGAKLMKRIGR